VKEDIADVVVGHVHASNSDLGSRLKVQERELARIKCIDPAIGRWIDANDLNYLQAAFDLDDKEFAARYPTLPPTTKAGRKELMRAFRRHVKACPHCRLKNEFDLELDKMVNEALAENREALLELLNESEPNED
jgi:hypothetical protein